ncbi:MAG: hypothetical protein GIW99_09720 [Candidatus Eremiobacteraeota bacterium]|nr:hypothetical protein [Candidatus Eremiobacteraeota bacterium]
MIGRGDDWAVFFAVLLDGRRGHGPPAPVIAAVRAILADGTARRAQDICREAIARELLPATTTSKYVRNAINALIMRERFNGEPEEIEHLASGEYRLSPKPAEPFSQHVEAPPPHPDVDALIDHLRKSARREIAPDPSDGPNTGAPFRTRRLRGTWPIRSDGDAPWRRTTAGCRRSRATRCDRL